MHDGFDLSLSDHEHVWVQDISSSSLVNLGAGFWISIVGEEYGRIRIPYGKDLVICLFGHFDR